MVYLKYQVIIDTYKKNSVAFQLIKNNLFLFVVPIQTSYSMSIPIEYLLNQILFPFYMNVRVSHLINNSMFSRHSR